MLASRTQEAISPVVALNGLFLIIVGISAIAIGLISLVFGDQNGPVFVLSGAMTIGVGFLAYFLRSNIDLDHMSMRQVLLSMISFWFTTSLFAAIPFMIGAPHFNLSFAFFETVSALTTTGATVMVGLDDMPMSVLLWRSLLHWYGGMGVVIGAMVLFPAMRFGGMQFFLRKGSENEDRLMPTARALGVAVLRVYAILTLLCGIAYMMSGMPFFDALNMSMSTMATGGLAVSDSSFMNYSDTAKLMASVFMVLAGIPLVIHIQFMNGRRFAYFRDSQVRVFVAVFLIFSILVTAYHVYHDHPKPYDALADAMFNTASIVTGKGFSDGDFQTWGSFPTALLFVGFFIGGCTGSTTGAIKIFRYQILYQMLKIKVMKTIYPSAIVVAKYEGERVDDGVIESVAAFMMIYIGSFALFSAAFGMTGFSMIESLSASASALGNVGPALGPQIGPVGSYADTSLIQRTIYTIGMLVGRLEFLAFLVVVLPRFWRH